MRFKDKFVRTVEKALHWNSYPHDRHIYRQNSPPDERDAEFAEECAANEARDAEVMEHELVSSSGSRHTNTQSKK